MNHIQLLDKITINKIAAGEVVERPSSVVKELVENSIDALATAITIEIKEGGTSFIRITDNGIGIPNDQVKTAFLSHATSKIRNIDDLEEVLSLGFRGEALASIAAVSQIEMTTKTQNEEMGTRIQISGGTVVSLENAVCTEGTTIIVKNLFYNVPARKKFLKKPSVESGYISEIINKLALGHTEISFKYISNETTVLHTSGNNDLKSCIFYVYGKDTSLKMLALGDSNEQYKIKGLIGKPETARANRSYENLFINGRFVRNHVVSSAVEAAYKTRILAGKFPLYVFNFEISPSLIDVNVHPAKLEVRFHNEEAIYEFIYNAVLNVLQKDVSIPEMKLENKPSMPITQLIREEAIQEKLPENLMKDAKPKSENFHSPIRPLKLAPASTQKIVLQEGKNPYKVKTLKPEEKNSNIEIKKEEQEKPKEYELFFNNYRIIGQLFYTYWLIEQSNSLFLIDQHSAHERILFEQLMNQFKKETVASQRLLQPMMMNLSALEKEVYKENAVLFQKFGFEVEEFGENSYVLHSVPFIFKNPINVNFFIEIIDTLKEDISVETIYDIKLLSIATMACKAAVKANDKLSIQEAVSMIEQLLKLEDPFHCPHGRPTIIEITKYELEKKFQRIKN